MKKIAIVGASGHGRVVADLAEMCGYQVFFFDDSFPNLKQIAHWSVIGSFSDLLNQNQNQNQGQNQKLAFDYAIVAIGDNETRSKLSVQLRALDFILPALIHPSAVVSQYAVVESGSVIFANAIINAFAKIGSDCIINTGTIVEHDCIIDNAVHLSPNVALAGATKVGTATWLGIGSVTKQGVEIGSHSIIGANSTVLTNISANVTAVGSPATVKKC